MKKAIGRILSCSRWMAGDIQQLWCPWHDDRTSGCPFGSTLDVLAPAAIYSALIPLFVFMLFQRYFVQGLLAGSVK